MGKKESDKLYREKHREELKIKNRLYYQNNEEKIKKKSHEYYLQNKDYLLEKSRRWGEENRDKWVEYYNKRMNNTVERQKDQCRKILRHAIEAGKIKRNPCAVCGTNECIEAHHEDYTKPFDIIWLCRRHHHELHCRSNGG